MQFLTPTFLLLRAMQDVRVTWNGLYSAELLESASVERIDSSQLVKEKKRSKSIFFKAQSFCLHHRKLSHELHLRSSPSKGSTWRHPIITVVCFIENFSKTSAKLDFMSLPLHQYISIFACCIIAGIMNILKLEFMTASCSFISTQYFIFSSFLLLPSGHRIQTSNRKTVTCSTHCSPLVYTERHQSWVLPVTDHCGLVNSHPVISHQALQQWLSGTSDGYLRRC